MTTTILATERCSPEAALGHSLWRAPLNRYTDQALLRYYGSRRSVRFFPVPDPEQTQRDKIDAILTNGFTFNSESYRLAEPIDWSTNPSTDLEWHVLLHKFYYAVGLGMAYQASGERRYCERWVALTESWIAQAPNDFCANPDLRLETSQVTGRRIQNWIYAYYYFVATADGGVIPTGFHRRFLHSLHDQVEYLRNHLSPARNHRTLELYAIFLAAVVFPEFCAAADWLALAGDETMKNMQADLLDDGVHCEQSTDYHHLVLKNYLCVRRLAQINDIRLPSEFDQRLIKALEFSMYVHKPDGVVPALSDGDTRSFRDLLQQGYDLYGREDMLYVATQGAEGKPPSLRSCGFSNSGYYILRSGWGEHENYQDERYLIFDCGPLGQGNHGHFDCLSFELAAFGRSLIVDPGRYTYNEQSEINWRARFRSTAYHNTVLVDGNNQTRYGPKPGKSRYTVQGAAPDYELKTFISDPTFDFIHGVAHSHEYDAIHERRIFFVGSDYWIIADTLTAVQPHDYELLFHLSEHAQDKVGSRIENSTRLVNSPRLLLAQCATLEISLHVDSGFVSYRYGHKHPAPVLRFKQRAAQAEFFTVLYPYRGEVPRLRIESIAIEEKQGDASAFRIIVEQNGQCYMDTCFFADTDIGHQHSFGDYRFDGYYLVLREDAQGALIDWHGNRGARLWNKSGQELNEASR